jgi:P-type Ca2+ transporter type 2C
VDTQLNTQGLTQNQVNVLLKQFGLNELKDTSSSSPLKILLRLIKNNFILYLLLVGSLVSFFVGESITAYTILIVMVVIIVISFFQEYRAEQAVKALKKMITQQSKVLRDGKEQEIPSSNLVPGDLLILRIGERVPADCLVVEESELRVNESILTGESQEVKKQVAQSLNQYSDQNLLFMGSFVINGKARAVVIHTGMNTKFGNIANLITTTEKSLPLQDKVNRIAKYMVIVAIVISLLTGILMALRVESWSLTALSSILVLMIALSVSAFPEGLPVVLVTTLAIGATRMAKQNAIVNRMSIIETLGETTVICADKTGTITTGEMTAQKVWLDGRLINISGVGYQGVGKFTEDGQVLDPLKNQSLASLLEAALICNDAQIELDDQGGEYKILGTPTEGSLMVLAAKADLFREDLKGKRVEEVPFNSERKMMSVLYDQSGRKTVYAKGAIEAILKNSKFLQKGNQVVELTKEQISQIEEVHQSLTKAAYRTIALAYKPFKGQGLDYKETDLIFLGFVGIDDSPREEVAESIALCQRAGITVKMITGDNQETALAVANQVGLFGKVLTGEELDRITDQELSNLIKDITIFARVRPEHKLRIVKVLKDQGEIVTMTGDGVNDAPALKEAHIGVAMGKNGTDVSRSVADLTLKDDNFATIVLAIKEGRTVFNNIRKFVSFQVACNWAELSILLLGVIFAPFFGWEIPIFLALQILFMNLVTDDLPALTLGFNSSSKDIMLNKPLRKAQILSKQNIVFMVIATILVTFCTLSAFYLSFNILGKSTEVSRTIAMVTLILLEIACVFSFRSFRFPVLSRSLFINPYLFWASLISIVITVMIIYLPINSVFGVVPIGLVEWILGVMGAIVLLVIFDLLKYFKLV